MVTGYTGWLTHGTWKHEKSWKNRWKLGWASSCFVMLRQLCNLSNAKRICRCCDGLAKCYWKQSELSVLVRSWTVARMACAHHANVIFTHGTSSKELLHIVGQLSNTTFTHYRRCQTLSRPSNQSQIGWACKTENFERLYEAGCQQKKKLCLSQSVFDVMITVITQWSWAIKVLPTSSNKGTLVVVALQDNQDFGSEPQQDHSWHSEWCTRPIGALGARHVRPGMHLACTTSHIKAWNQNERKWKTIPSKMILLSKIQDFHGCFERRTVLSCCWSLLSPAPP